METLEISGSGQPDSAVIWLHGLGADGYDFAPVVEQLQLPTVRFILPHAPYRPVTINNNYTMRAWFDLYGLEAGSRQDDTGIREAQDGIETLIRNEQARGIDPARIVLAGFSQGGAIALHTALRYQERLAGVIGLSTYLPLRPLLAAEAHPSNQGIPIFMAHGEYDEVIAIDLARPCAAFMEQQGYAVGWHEYPMPHSVCMQEIDDIRDFLRAVLG